jgi:hypothetical protein
MPQEDDGGSQVKHPKEILWVAFPADHDATIVMQPREQAFDFPSTAIAPQRATILGQSSGAHGPVWRDHLDAVVLHQPLIEAVAVVGAIADQPFGEVGEESFFERGFDEFGFMRRSAGHVHGERKTMAVADRHDFAAFTASSRADGGAPFFAELKLASTNASLRSSLPRSRKSSASFWSNCNSTPERCQC